MDYYQQVISELDKRGIGTRERKLLFMLEQNARVRLSELAGALKISEEAVRQKIAKLEKGAIAGYQTIINLPKIGVESFRVYVVLSCRREEKEKFMKYLLESGKIWWVAETNGEWNFDFVVWSYGNWDFWLFWKEFYVRFGGINKKWRINPYTELTFLPRTFLVSDERHRVQAKKYDGEKRVELDKKEKLLLSDIAFRARDPYADICRRTGLSYGYVAGTIRRLEKEGVILGYRALIDRKHLGLDYYKADVNVSSTDKVAELEAYVLRNPFVIYIDNAIGGSSFEFDFLVASSDHAKEILDDVRAICGSCLDHLEFFQALNELKLAHFPLK